MKAFLLPLLLALLQGCGAAGKLTGSTSPGDDHPGIVSTTSTHVTGTFYVGSTDHPAAGFEAWVFDHTTGTFDREVLDENGGFTLPLAYFQEQHAYSLHLVGGFRLYGDVDLAPDVAGTQAAFQYQGGEGFDFGKLVVPLDKHDEPDLTGKGLAGAIGGGFAVLPSMAATFASFPIPAPTATLQLGSQLYAFDPESLGSSFFNRDAAPDAYGRDLQRLSRIGGVAVGKTAGDLQRVFIADAGAWLDNALVPSGSAVDAAPEQGALWAGDYDSFTAVPGSKTRFEASVYARGVPAPGTVAIVRVQPTAGPEGIAPLVIPRVLTVPPQVTAFTGNGGPPAPVDYTSTTGANGLDRPFCQSGEVVFDVTPPRDDTGQPVPATILGHVEVAVDYYTTGNGKTQPLAVTAAQLPAPFKAKMTDPGITDETRVWDPTTLTMSTDLGPSMTALAAPEIHLWPQLFPAKINGQTVTFVRLRVYVKSTTEATAGAAAVWLQLGC